MTDSNTTELRTGGSKVYMTDGKHVRKIHYYDQGCMGARAWIRAPWKKVENCAASPKGAVENLVKRMKDNGWRIA